MLEDIKQGYTDCMLWFDSPKDDHDEGIENFGLSELLTEYIDRDIKLFIDTAGELIREAATVDNYDLGNIGHDLWLTRNGHGAGLWDGDLPEELGQRLTDIAKSMGNVDLYVGDDGYLYQH